MRGPAIRVENLGKMYRIGGPVERYRTFRDSVAQGFARAGRRVRSWFGGGNGAAPKYETIWALKDVSFEIQPGEVVGVIGRNGAGKSTLLKILSRITEPTEGRAVVRGRIGSLLEVGTGFHPELTGRENVYLNGAILGMKRAEVDRKFDEIVAFAEIEKFIDTPVKHYSSGMYLRLGFSVAAHLEPDVLLVDEVLAVGDVLFQKKCLAKAGELSRSGRTVILVTHNLGALQHLCNKAIVLSKGRMATHDHVADAIRIYLEALNEGRSTLLRHDVTLSADQKKLVEVEVNSILKERPVWITGEQARLKFKVASYAKQRTDIIMTIYDNQRRPVASCTTKRLKAGETPVSPNSELEWCCNELPLTPGVYFINVALAAHDEILEHQEDAVHVEVIPGRCYGRYVETRAPGCVLLDYQWITKNRA